MPDPSLPTAPDVQWCEMRLSHCLILFELGLLFIQVKFSLLDTGRMEVGEARGRQVQPHWGPWASIHWLHFDQSRIEEWMSSYTGQYWKSVTMPALEFYPSGYYS